MTYYKRNREKRITYQREYYLKNREKIIEDSRVWASKNKEKKREYGKRYREKHRELVNQRQRKYLVRLRMKVLNHYSTPLPKCACCGESILEFLTIDHINNDGAKHRKKIGGSHSIYRWLVKNNFPEGFQVLCLNCNCGKQMSGGVCPHIKNR